MSDKIEFIDQTIRDAQQSLWGMTMRTEHMLPIAETMDKVGYLSIATVGSQAFTVQVRTLHEDPWERIKALSKLITKTPIRGSYVIGSLSSFDLSTPRDIISLWVKRSVANGTSLPATESILKNAKRLGFTSDLDEDALAAVSEHFKKIAETEGYPIGAPMEYDVFHYEHQVPGGMMTNLTRQLKEVGMQDRLDAMLEEVVHVRKDLGYPVMATPYSQIVGAQALENVISGERYKNFTDEVVKYVLGLYGEPAAPIDKDVMEKVMNSPQAEKLKNWKPANYEASVEELRKQYGPELSDDELLLKICIPGVPTKPSDKKPAPPPKKIVQPSFGDYPAEFDVDVDGETFRVRITPASNGTEAVTAERSTETKKGSKQAPPGSVLCGMAGLVLSFNVKIGDTVSAGDLIAMIEAMKMRRPINSPHGGVVQEIWANEGEIVSPEDVLMVVV